MKQIAKQIYKHICKAKKVLLVPHQNPDGDALGSVGAFMQFLENENIPYSVYCKTKIPLKLEYLPYIEKISQNNSLWNDPEIDTIVVFDSGDLRYAGIDEQISARKNVVVINIDHHPTNEFYGDFNLVVEGASSTAGILYRFFVYNNIYINQETATCLLTGLITDTDNFTNSATNISSLHIASDLINKGGDLKKIQTAILKNKSIPALHLWGVALSRLTHHKKTDIVHTYVTQSDLEKHKITDEEADGLANFMNNIQDGKASIILKETTDGKIKGSFRTTKNDTNVSSYAKYLGGGGHKKAAGFIIEGPIEKALENVLNAVTHIDTLALQKIEI